MTTLRGIIDRVRNILKTEGLASLLRKGLRSLVSRFFAYETHYLYETIPENFRTLNETDFKPKIDNFTIKIVSTNQEADRLETEGLELRSSTRNSRQLLDKGAIAFCIFVGRELVHIGWIRMTEQTAYKMKVDFSKNEVESGYAWTNPKYRGMRFQQYSAFKRRQFALSKGKTVFRSHVDKWNIASQSAVGKVATKYGEGRYLRIMWWEFWKENPLS